MLFSLRCVNGHFKNGHCYCGEFEVKVIDKEGKTKCLPCKKCEEVCTARKHRCDNKVPVPEEEAHICERPGPNQYIKHGDFESCGDPCKKNEFELVLCHCGDMRSCICQPKHYRSSANDCKKCSLCQFEDHPRVSSQCNDLPENQVIIYMLSIKQGI